MDTTTSILKKKAALRKHTLAKRSAMDAGVRSEKSVIASTMLKQSLERMLGEIASEPAVVAVYSAMKSELSLDAFIRYAYARGVTVCFPCMTAIASPEQALQHPSTASGERRSYMVMRAVSIEPYIHEDIVFVNKPLSIWQIDDSALDEYLIVEPQAIDMLVVPIVAFDGNCNRLGYGGGNYDSILPHVREDCQIIGVAFDEQRIEGLIPLEAHDKPLPAIVSC